MPPRSFSEIVPSGHSYSWGVNVLLERPEHAALVASVISAWSHVEVQLVKLLATVMKGSARAALEMFKEARSFDRKSKLVGRVARIELPSDDADLIEAVLDVVGPSAQERNHFAHHIWGVCPFIDDGILLFRPDLHTDFELYGLEMSQRHPRRLDRQQPELHRYPESIRVYQLADLREVLAEMGRACVLLSQMNFCLSMSPAMADESAALRQELINSKGVAATLAQRAAKRAQKR